jgi:hypothetical protein
MKKTLTIILCQTREGNFTYNSLVTNVLTPLDSDLAFCGSAESNFDDAILRNSKYIWNFPEPIDWAETCDLISTDGGNWRELVKLDPEFLGGSGLYESVGSGLIVMYWREILRQHITESIIDEYEWFVITRSDFLWEIEHPKIEMLNKNTIYLLDGEKYSGISDRHIIFSKDSAKKCFEFAKPIFGEALRVKEELIEQQLVGSHLNPERYLLFITNKFGLNQNLRFIPYLGFTIRHEQTKTRWSSGVLDPDRNYYIKYPGELAAVTANKLQLRSEEDWFRVLN